ncbi:hypothetical protein SAMN05444143_101935 [Flavobacterium succinicans]|uniref:Uncharacterized protein n=1 Tax=Flavobacterium succinicans TaxID=29536 RepID=A0A1I4SQ28_9FLAO|nr:hypothetical protein SAMN05444143_101935 [Flavobacterium succinicans]
MGNKVFYAHSLKLSDSNVESITILSSLAVSLFNKHVSHKTRKPSLMTWLSICFPYWLN